MLQHTVRAASRLAVGARLQGLARCAPLGSGRAAISPAARRLPSHPAQWLSTTRQLREQDGKAAASPDITTDNFFSNGAEATTNGSENPNPPSDDLPWYLKVDVPKHATLVPQEVPLPAIPANAPALMAPLLSYVADDMGLDDLQLLDLRALDPPAALGPNLLMLFGTARSERHLHVSADRLVRWLRGRGIHANADGLLGRNELKIKLRRKARRAKLLGGFGALTAASSAADGTVVVDDGISTQWVCLHAGTLGRAGEEGRSVDAEGRTSGFGTVRAVGTTVVVQMFTEAKRRQLDLETLWSRALNRSLRRRTEEGEDVEVEAAEPAAAKAGAAPLQQRRPFSTSARRLAVGSSDVVSQLTSPTLDWPALEKAGQQLDRSAAEKVRVLDQLALYLDSLPQPDAIAALGTRQSSSTDNDNDGTPSDFVRAASYCLRDLSAADTWPFRSSLHATALRHGHPDYTAEGMAELVREMQRTGVELARQPSLRILRSLFSVGPLASEAAKAAEDAADRLQALRRRSELALSLLDTMQARGQAVMANDVLVTMIAALARAHPRVDSSAAVADEAAAVAQNALDDAAQAVAQNALEDAAQAVAVAIEPVNQDSLDAAVQAEAVFGVQDLLEEDMSEAEAKMETETAAEADRDGVVSAEQFEALFSALEAPTPRARVPDPLPEVILPWDRARPAPAVAEAAERMQAALEQVRREAGLPCPDEATLLFLLDAYAAQNDWTRFWAAWRLPPQHGLPRSATLYTYALRRLAATRHQRRCTQALRWLVPEMAHETPPVRLRDGVLAAAKACIRVADPQAELLARNLTAGYDNWNRLNHREFVRLLRAVEASE